MANTQEALFTNKISLKKLLLLFKLIFKTKTNNNIITIFLTIIYLHFHKNYNILIRIQ